MKFLNANHVIIDFPADNNNSASFKFKANITGRTGNDGKREFLKYLSSF